MPLVWGVLAAAKPVHLWSVSTYIWACMYCCRDMHTIGKVVGKNEHATSVFEMIRLVTHPYRLCWFGVMGYKRTCLEASPEAHPCWHLCFVFHQSPWYGQPRTKSSLARFRRQPSSRYTHALGQLGRADTSSQKQLHW